MNDSTTNNENLEIEEEPVPEVDQRKNCFAFSNESAGTINEKNKFSNI